MTDFKWFTVYRQVGPTQAKLMEQTTVMLSGVSPNIRIVPWMAREAAKLAFGVTSGVWVYSNDEVGYALYPASHRELEPRDLERYRIVGAEEIG